MASAKLNIMHLAVLDQLSNSSSRGATGPGRPFELGPAPTDVPEDFKPGMRQQLVDGGFLTTTGDLTDLGHQVLDPLVDYESAFFGLILLRNQRQAVQFPIDDQWIHLTQAGGGDIRDSLSFNTPRVYVLFTKVGEVITCAVRTGQQVTINQAYITDGFPAAAANWAWSVCNPQGLWEPADMAAAALPYEALAAAPGRRPHDGADDDTRASYRQYSDQYVRRLRDTWRLGARTAATVQQILELDHVGSMQLQYTEGPHRETSDHSLTFDFFHNAGVLATYPSTIADGSVWKHYAPATPEARRTAFLALADDHRSPSLPITAALAKVPPQNPTQ